MSHANNYLAILNRPLTEISFSWVNSFTLLQHNPPESIISIIKKNYGGRWCNF